MSEQNDGLTPPVDYGSPGPAEQVWASAPDHRLADAVTSAWRWGMATLFLFPVLGFWALPAAGQATLAASRGDHGKAREAADRARTLGMAAIIVCVVLLVLFVGVAILGAVVADDPEPARSTNWR